MDVGAVCFRTVRNHRNVVRRPEGMVGVGDRTHPLCPMVYVQCDIRKTRFYRHVVYVVDRELLQHEEVEK